MQTEWQKKLMMLLGILGAGLVIGQSVLATLVWPVYNVATYPLAVLTANGSPYQLSFMLLNGVAALLILLSLFTILNNYRHAKQEKLSKALQGLIMALVLWLGLQLLWPLSNPAMATMGGTPIRNGVVSIGIILVAYALYHYSQPLRKQGDSSLANVLLVFSILFVLFHVLAYIMQVIGWSLQGFFDVLATDSLAAGLGFIGWYYWQRWSR
ncbi:hypothetical protein [Weissella halotolerans]|uniref:DUF998 domain-containing protein n=1 Tax=Weissella halotolerans DSM 20190 TaxID=1123500 RepID=A0A0R2G895_9LACO|nr:hypothetical protein [Weissella halotolerans]KRN33402.1 hypothetical protein IV68_GL000200 [Weissella halotolerans DSM 20190]